MALLRDGGGGASRRTQSTPAGQRGDATPPRAAGHARDAVGLHHAGRVRPTQDDMKARARSPSGRAECVCEMCTCGRHSCPVHGRREMRPFSGHSEYHDVYKAHDMQDMRRELLRQQQAEGQERWSSRPRAKFEGESKSREDYQAPPIEALRAALQPPSRREKVHGSRAPLESTTSYKADYPWKQPAPLDSSSLMHGESLDSQRSRPRFEGESSYHRDYYRKQLPAEPAGPPPHEPQRPRSRFEGISQAAEAYRPYAAEDYLQALRPPQSPHRDAPPSRKGPFDGTTTSGAAFAPPPREAYRQQAEPHAAARPPSSTARFAGESEYVAAYPRHEGEALRAAHGWQPAAAPPRSRPDDRDFATTATSAFRAPPARPPCPAGELVREHPPPTPPSGREHVYYDRDVGAWY